MERFWAKALEADNGCLEWTLCRNSNGYGSLNFRGKWAQAHRVAYILAYGEIPIGMCVLHSCDNRLCIRPSHLRLGTQSENLLECVSKKRDKQSTKPNNARGEHNGQSKLSVGDVQEIKRRRTLGETYEAISRSYAVTSVLISRICRGKAWKWVN